MLAVPGRRALLGELSAALRHRGPYRGSSEELTPVHDDLCAALPVALAAAALLVRPGPRDWMARDAVISYVLGARGWRSLLEAAERLPPSRERLTDLGRVVGRDDGRG